MLRNRDFAYFYLLTFLFLALLPLLSLVFNNGSMDFSAAAASASESTGILWTSNIISVFRLSLAEPVLLLMLLGSLAPALAAITMLCFLRNGELWSRFCSRFTFYRKCSPTEAGKTYLAIFAILIPYLFVVYEFRTWLGLDYERSVTVDLYLISGLLAITLFDQGALLEEVGWRGFAGPELQKILQSPLIAAIIIGLAWGLWHLPRDITTGVIERLGAVTYLTMFLPSFLVGTISSSIIICHFMNRVGGSIFVAIMIHGLTNDAIGISGSASIVEALTPVHQITKSLPLAVIAIVIVLMSSGRLGLQQELADEGPRVSY